MSSTRIEALIDEMQVAFDHRPTNIETGLDVKGSTLLQLQKVFRLLAGHLFEQLTAAADELGVTARIVPVEKLDPRRSEGYR